MVFFIIWRCCTIPRNGLCWQWKKRFLLYYHFIPRFWLLAVLFCYKLVRWCFGKNQILKKLCVNAMLGKWISEVEAA